MSDKKVGDWVEVDFNGHLVYAWITEISHDGDTTTYTCQRFPDSWGWVKDFSTGTDFNKPPVSPLSLKSGARVRVIG